MRKSILIFGHNYATQFVDIYNQYTRLFNKDDYEVTVAFLTGEPDEEIKQRMLAEHVLFLNIPKKNIRALKLCAVQKLYKLCKDKQFELVVCHRYKPSYIMLLCNRLKKIPALFFVMHELGTMSSKSRQLLIRVLGKDNLYLAGVSNAVRNDIRKDLSYLPDERILTLYNMMDVELTEPYFYSREEAREKLNLASDDIVFGNVARLVRNKDQATLIKAFALINSNCPKAKLIIMGTGDLEQRLKQQVADANLQHNVIFTDHLPQAFRYMKAFDSFVLTSIQEAFGRVLLEAMTAKVPVIAARVNGIPEVIDSSGTLVKPQDVNGFAAAMQNHYILSTQEREMIGQKGYERVVQYFSIPAFRNLFWQLPSVQFLKA